MNCKKKGKEKKDDDDKKKKKKRKKKTERYEKTKKEKTLSEIGETSQKRPRQEGKSLALINLAHGFFCDFKD